MPKRIHSINVDFDNKIATIQTFGYEIVNEENVDTGLSSSINISGQAFDQMMVDLQNANALDMTAVLTYLTSI